MNTLASPTPRVKSSTARKPRKKPERHIRLLSVLDSGAGILQVVEGKETDRYFFAPIASDFGRAFTVEKWQDAAGEAPAGVVQRYDVCLNGKASLCACKGFLRWGHCRHVEGLTALAEAGKLDTAPAAPTSKPVPCLHENVFQHEDGELCCADCNAGM